MDETGCFSDPAPHKLIILGDIFDRGQEAVEMQCFILALLEQDAVILLRGNHEDLFGGWRVTVNKFLSNRVMTKIHEYNQKAKLNAGKKSFPPIEISDEGLELIEYLSLDCTAATGEWHSDSEVKIDKMGYVIRNGVKTKDFWDGSIASEQKPLRLKIRNICGDETVWEWFSEGSGFSQTKTTHACS